MQRCWPEIAGAGHLKGLGLELGVTIEFRVDDRLDAALGAELGQELTEDSITETVKALDLTAELEVGDDLDRDLADGPEQAAGGRACWGARHDRPDHHQIARCPK